MEKNLRLRFRRGDFIAIAAVAILAVAVAAIFLPGGNEAAAEVHIYQDGQLLRSLPLNQDQSVAIGGDYENTVSIHGGTVAITESTCPGMDCVHSGSIRSVGRSIVCLPNRLEVRIEGASESEVDFIVG